MIDSTAFIGLIVIAIVQALKEVFPQISGAITTIVSVVVGAILAALAPHIGIAAISVADGALIGLSSAGAHTIVSSIGRKNQTPPVA